MSFSKEEIKNLKQLLEVEKIRYLRMKYNQLIDSRDLSQLVNLFTPDGVCEFGPYGSWKGRGEIYKNYLEVFEDNWMHKFSSMHYNTNHLVDLIDDHSARGTCYLLDIDARKSPQENPLIWLAFYDETYVKVDQEWKISKSAINFVWPERILSSYE